jgi:predicted negative regulator of RcsB-dependent stress response
LLQAANYYYTTDRDLEQALEWVNTYLNEGNNSQQFWNVHLKAKILAKMGKKKEAKATAEKSMEMAKSNPNGDFGYVKLNKDLIDSL